MNYFHNYFDNLPVSKREQSITSAPARLFTLRCCWIKIINPKYAKHLPGSGIELQSSVATICPKLKKGIINSNNNFFIV